MTGVGDSGELGENARVPSADLVELDVRDGLQAPIQTCPLGVGKRRGQLLELGGVEDEETGTKAVDGCAMFSIGGVRDGDVVEDSEAHAGGFEFGPNDLEKIGDFQALRVKCARCGCWGNGGVGGGGLCGGDARGEGGAGKALLEGAALLLSALLGNETLNRGAVAVLTRVDLVPVSRGEGAWGYTGRFGNVLDDGADVARRVVIGASRLAARLEDVGDELGEVAAKTRLRSGARFAGHYQTTWVRCTAARAASKLTG